MAKERKEMIRPRRTDLTTKEMAYVLAFTAIGTETCSHQGKSAQKAGFPKKEINKHASRLMKRPEIRSAIQDIHQQMMDEAMINPAKILADLENTKNLALAKGDLVSANRSIHLQGQYLTMFGDRYVPDVPEQRELNAKEKAEARRISLILLNRPTEQNANKKEPVEPFTDTEILNG